MLLEWVLVRLALIAAIACLIGFGLFPGAAFLWGSLHRIWVWWTEGKVPAEVVYQRIVGEHVRAIARLRNQVSQAGNNVPSNPTCVRLAFLELQLRQYETGRAMLLAQLEAAKTAQEQYELASRFDPNEEVANWCRKQKPIGNNSP